MKSFGLLFLVVTTLSVGSIASADDGTKPVEVRLRVFSAGYPIAVVDKASQHSLIPRPRVIYEDASTSIYSLGKFSVKNDSLIVWPVDRSIVWPADPMDPKNLTEVELSAKEIGSTLKEEYLYELESKLVAIRKSDNEYEPNVGYRMQTYRQNRQDEEMYKKKVAELNATSEEKIGQDFIEKQKKVTEDTIDTEIKKGEVNELQEVFSFAVKKRQNLLRNK